MHTLLRYLKPYWRFALLALGLAAVNQIFSLLDPLIFRHVIDSYATQYDKYTRIEFFKGVALLLSMAVGVAFVSRVAKNFQDYFVNVIVQRVGADLYSDGIRHSLALPFQTFEDQRSGETLGKLQKVRSDTERFIAAFVNMVFTTLVGVIFVMVYAFKAHWAIAPAFLLTGALSASVLNATANAAGSISYTPSAGSVLAAGSVTLSANFTPSDAQNYNPASKSVTLPVLDSSCGTTVIPTTLPAVTRGTPFVLTL